MKTATVASIFAAAIVGSLLISLSCKDEKTVIQVTEEFQFPKIDWIDPAVYDEIKATCGCRWNLQQMIASTFEIRRDYDEYAIYCDGYLEGQLYHFVIRVDANGKWINDGRSPKGG